MINIGNEAVLAIKELRGNRHFDALVESLWVLVQTKMFEAAKTPPADRIDRTSYATGMYELWGSVYAAYAEIPPSQVKPPVSKRAA